MLCFLDASRASESLVCYSKIIDFAMSVNCKISWGIRGIMLIACNTYPSCDIHPYDAQGQLLSIKSYCLSSAEVA